MSWCQFSLSYICSCLVGIVSEPSRIFSLVTCGKLGKVSMIVTLPAVTSQSHFVVEDLRFTGLSRGNQVLVEYGEDIIAYFAELGFDLNSVALDFLDLSFISFALFLLFNGRDDTPGRSASSNHILVCDRQ